MLVKTLSVTGALALFLTFGFTDNAPASDPLERSPLQLSANAVSATSLTPITLAQHRGPHNKQGKNRGGRGMQRQRRGQGGRGQNSHQGVMQDARTLVMNHGSLSRKVIEIPNGVRTISTTTDPAMVPVLQSHPREMDQHLSKGGQVRNWDPFFAEIAKQHDKIEMTFKNLDNGIEVVSTSDDPEVVKLIRAHAYKVSEFVTRGRDAAHESTPIPKGYIPPKDNTK